MYPTSTLTRFALLGLLILLMPRAGKGQDRLKLLDGDDLLVRVVKVGPDTVTYVELGDPLLIDYYLPRNRVREVIYEDGVREDLARTPPPNTRTLSSTPRPVVARPGADVLYLKDGTQLEGQITRQTDESITIRIPPAPGSREVSLPQVVVMARIERIEYGDGRQRRVSEERNEEVAGRARPRLLPLSDPATAEAWLAANPPARLSRSSGRLFQPGEVLVLRHYRDLKQALKERAEVRFLDLSHQNLTTLPPEVLECKRLLALDLTGNPLGAFPDQLLALPNLQYLWLDSCQIKELRPNFSSDKQSNLFYISAQYNEIEDLHPSLGSLGSLYVLNLAHNRIKRVRNRGTFTGVADPSKSSLAVLDLSHNGLEFMPVALEAYPQLTWLNLRHNALARGTEKLETLKRLRWMDLSHNPLESLTPEFWGMPALTTLDLGHTRLTDLPGSSLVMSRLEGLTLPASVRPLPGGLAANSRLRYLAITGTPGRQPVPIPRQLSWTQLDLARLEGWPGSGAWALALRPIAPKATLTFQDSITGKPALSPGRPDSAGQLTRLAAHRQQPGGYKALGTYLINQRQDRALGHYAWVHGAFYEPAQSAECLLALADFYTRPDSPLDTTEQLPQRVSSLAHYRARAPHCRSLQLYRQVCQGLPEGQVSAAQKAQACKQQKALERQLADTLEATVRHRPLEERSELRAEIVRLRTP